MLQIVEPASHAEPRVTIADAGRRASDFRRQSRLATVPAALPDNLAFVVVAVLRRHGHISNVLTHISGGNWTKV